MKKTTLILLALISTMTIMAQPKLTKDNIDKVLQSMTLEEKASLVVGMRNMTPDGSRPLVPGAAGGTRPIERLGITSTILADGPAGLRISPTHKDDDATYYCTGFPVGTAIASSWDVAMVEDMTKAMGNEVLEYGVDVLLAPGMNIHRNPLCGRNFEYFSEDPVLSGKTSAAYVRGIQSNGVGTSVKHFAANNQETNRLENDVIASKRALREIYLKNFEITIKEGEPWTVMSSYNKINGQYTQQSIDLLTKVLRNDWGYEGIVMTDWGWKDGTVAAVKAGNDLMEPGNAVEIKRIMDAVQSDNLPMADLDRNVRRMLEYIVKTPRYKGYAYSNQPDLKAHAQVARTAATESMVLLKNEDNTLPLGEGKKVALFGASSVDFIAGGTGSGNVNKAYVVNLAEGLMNAGFALDSTLSDFYKKYVDFMKVDLKKNGNHSSILLGDNKIPEAFMSRRFIDATVKNNDVAVLVIGRNSGEGADRAVDQDFTLSSDEINLMNNVCSAYHLAGKKVVVVLNIGGVIETASWKQLPDAILCAWQPGQEGGNAVADVLLGKANPSGKLPMTFPIAFSDIASSRNFPLGNRVRDEKGKFKHVDYTNYEEGIWVGYRYFDTQNVPVSYPFGYGLSYTTFEYSKPVVKAEKDGGFTASITVKNTGKVAGKEVVEVYVTAPKGGLEKPAKELKAFAKTRLLAPGESETLHFSVSDYELASFNEEKNQWETAAGTYTVHFAKNVNEIPTAVDFKVKKAKNFSVSDAW